MLESINILSSGQGIRHIGIYVSDLLLMKHFYMNVFNMHLICDDVIDQGEFFDKLYGKENTEVHITKLITHQGKKNGTGDMIELLSICNNDATLQSFAGRLTDIGRMHIAFEVGDIYFTTDKIIKEGGKILIFPFVRENGNQLAFCCDPEGNYLELIQRKNMC